MASMCGGRLMYLRNGFTVLEMTQEFDKWLMLGLHDEQLVEQPPKIA